MKEKPMNPDKVKRTLVIPTYTLTYELRDLAYRCALSHRGQVDQIIITEDGGMFSNQLKDIADIYLYSKKNVGFTKNVNRGWKLSDGDMTIIANSDTELIEGNLRDLDIQSVCVPEIVNTPNTGFTGSYFSVPRDIQEKYGYLDERLENFYSDVDYGERVKPFLKLEKRIVIKHQKSQTLKIANVESRRDNDEYRKIITEEHPERITWK